MMKKEFKKTYSKLRSRKEVTLTFPMKQGDVELFPSLNKIMRQHWSNWKKIKDILHWMIKEQTHEHFDVPVEIEFHRYYTRLLDWDNAASSFKFCGDALQSAGVIDDDNAVCVHRFTPFQHKVKKKKEEKVIVKIWEYLQ